MKKDYYKSSKEKKSYSTKPLALKPLDEVKGFFRQYFKKHSSEGHVMTKADVILHVLKKLTAKEDAIFSQALASLAAEGFIEVQEDGVTVVLTKKGSDSFK